MEAYALAGGELAGTTILVDEGLLGCQHPMIRVPASDDADFILLVSRDQEWIEVLWPIGLGAAYLRRTQVYHRNGREYLFTGEGRAIA